MRFLTRQPSALWDFVGRTVHNRQHALSQKYPDTLHTILENFCSAICGSRECDPVLVSRLLSFLREDRVTYLLVTYAMTGSLALAAKAKSAHPFEYLVIFQGEELYTGFAHRGNALDGFFDSLQKVVARSAWPAIAVSHDYAERPQSEMGIDPHRIRVIYPGTLAAPCPPAPAEPSPLHFPGSNRMFP